MANGCTIEQGIALALDAITEGRLAAICGAGLSMAPPSSLPSAAAIAAEVKTKYDGINGLVPGLSANIEEQAEFFFGNGNLGSMFIRTLVPRHAFSAPPNAGHFAIADLLLSSAVNLAITTNVDTLIESAGNHLYGDVPAPTDRNGAASRSPGEPLLLKIHGCWKNNSEETVWAPSQLTVEPLQTRISECADWLRSQLLDRELLIVGYFTDWSYLNDVLQSCLGAVRPSRVIVVDPCATTQLAAKAPALFDIGSKSTREFLHIQESGADFLHQLRYQWSKRYVRQSLHAGRQVLIANGDPRAHTIDPEPIDLDIRDFWQIRRDIEGVGPRDPSRTASPPLAPLVGYMHLLLRHAGAAPDGAHWKLNNRTIRVLNGSSKALQDVERQFGSSTSPLGAAEITVAVGAVDLYLAPNIARPKNSSSIVRGSSSRFITVDTAISELSL